jgi:hypothetical protein
MGGHLLEEEIQNIFGVCEKYFPIQDINNFVETGTYRGDTTIEATKMFNNVFTMEINSERFDENVSKFAEQTDIHAFLGDSVELLPKIMSDIHGPCCWFLDAHQSGPDTSNNGKEWVPLLNELRAIFSNEDKHSGVIIIDDVRLYSKHWDWESVSLVSIDKCLKELGVEILKKFVSNDRYILVVVST